MQGLDLGVSTYKGNMNHRKLERAMVPPHNRTSCRVSFSPAICMNYVNAGVRFGVSMYKSNMNRRGFGTSRGGRRSIGPHVRSVFHGNLYDSVNTRIRF